MEKYQHKIKARKKLERAKLISAKKNGVIGILYKKILKALQKNLEKSV